MKNEIILFTNGDINIEVQYYENSDIKREVW